MGGCSEQNSKCEGTNVRMSLAYSRDKCENELGLFKGWKVAFVPNYLHFLSETSVSPPCLSVTDCSFCLECYLMPLSAGYVNCPLGLRL